MTLLSTVTTSAGMSPLLPHWLAVELNFECISDLIIGNISSSSVDGTSLTNSSTFSGQSSANNFTYKTDVTYVWGLLPDTSVGINHNTTVGVNGHTAIDGWVALLDVTITTKPSG